MSDQALKLAISPSRNVYFVDFSSFSRRERVQEYGFSAILRDLQLCKMCRNVRLLKSHNVKIVEMDCGFEVPINAFVGRCEISCDTQFVRLLGSAPARVGM